MIIFSYIFHGFVALAYLAVSVAAFAFLFCLMFLWAQAHTKSLVVRWYWRVVILATGWITIFAVVGWITTLKIQR